MTDTPTSSEQKQYKKLSISFYGGLNMFSKKESPLVAREIYCCADSCDLRDASKCVCMRNSLHWLDRSYDCPFGKTEEHKGYTSRARKYYSFREKYESDPAYEVKLDKPDKYFFGKADGHYVIRFEWAGLRKDEESGQWYASKYATPAFIPEDEFDIEKIYEMLMYKGDRSPRMIKERDDEHIPLFLRAFAKGEPDKCGLLLMLHPELGDYKLNVIGKKAYLRTLVDGSVVTLDRKRWVKTGNKIVCNNCEMRDLGVFGRGRAELEIDPDYVIKVEREEWCDENTEYKS